MVGKKRSSSDAGMATRGGSKSAKTEGAAKPTSKAKGAAKRGPKAPAANAFKARALPLHVNVTHTPPAIPEDGTENSSTADPGHVATLSLLPSTFKTGSYGWTGQKRFSIELDDPEGTGSKEKVHIMLNINATVVGSKSAEKDDDAEEEKAEEGDTTPEEKAAEEAEAEVAEEKAEVIEEVAQETADIMDEK